MKLYYDRASKNPTYFIQHGFRNGSKTSTKNIHTIGTHAELLAITADPLEYARKQVAQFNKEYKEGKVKLSFTVDFDEKLSATENVVSKSTLLNIGYFVLQRIYRDLGLKEYFCSAQDSLRVTYDCNTINRFLTYARVLDPKSKHGTFDELDTYYEKPAFGYQHIMRFMDVLHDNYDGYLERLFEYSNKVVKRDTSVCYFDCTNYYFETEEEDEDYVDAVTGEWIKGLRKYGVSKEHRPNPIVQMGLFMDGQGIPLSMCVNSGSDNEQKCAVPLERKIVSMFNGKPFIYCADAGLGSFNIRKYNAMGGRAFIVTQSVKKLSDTLQAAVFNDYDYKLLSSNARVSTEFMKSFDRSDKDNRALYDDTAYKVVIADKAIDVGLTEEKIYLNGKTRNVKSKALLKQRVIITYSRKIMEYQRHIRNRQIERAGKLLRERNVEDVKKGPHDITRFIKRASVGKNGEKASDHYYIDQSVIDNEEKYDGYYAVATNLDDPAKDILAINSQRFKIEDCFRIMKTNFGTRPISHSKRKRIIAHFLICYTALLTYRLLEVKLDQYGEHFTTDDILKTLRNMNVMNAQDIYYASAYTSSRVCTALNRLFDLGLDKKYYQPKDLNRKIKKLLN